jgi:uncharacterized RDD family membrane protein YckC
LFTTVGPLKEGWGLLLFALGFCLFAFGLFALEGVLGFGLGFGFVLLLWVFWCGKLLEGKRITEGKRMTKGKLLKGKEWLKRSG